MPVSPCVFCYCFDASNTLAAIVSAQSIIDTLEGSRPVVIAMITTDTEFDSDKIDTRGKPVRIDIHKIDNPFDSIPAGDHISPATFMRFLISDYIDPAFRRVLYIDADTVARCDLLHLFDTDLSGAPVAAVPNYSILLGGKYWHEFRLWYAGKSYEPLDYLTEVLGIDPSKNEYLSCGVLLIDLAQWKGICASAIAFIERSAPLCYLDQDALTAVLKGNFVHLAPEYNALSDAAHPDGRSFRDRLSGYANDLHRIIRIWRVRAKIGHFAGPHKPWLETSEPTGLEVYWWRAARRSRVFNDVAHLAYREHAKAAPKRC